MNKWLLAAGILGFVTVLLHEIGGGAGVHVPILESSLSVDLKAISSVIWHGIGAILLINSGATLLAAWSENLRRPLIFLICVQYAAFTMLFLYYGITRQNSVLLMPQWTIFLVLIGLLLMGIRREKA